MTNVNTTRSACIYQHWLLRFATAAIDKCGKAGKVGGKSWSWGCQGATFETPRVLHLKAGGEDSNKTSRTTTAINH